MSPQGAGTEPPSSHSPMGYRVTPSPSPAPSLPRAPFPSLHCQLQPHTACYQSFLNEHQHLIYFSKTYCFACMDPAWEARVETSTQIPEPSAHQSVNAGNLGSITHPAKSGLGSVRQQCSNFPLKQLPAPSMLLGITVSHLQTREQMWLKSFHCCNSQTNLLAVEGCQIFQMF